LRFPFPYGHSNLVRNLSTRILFAAEDYILDVSMNVFAYFMKTFSISASDKILNIIYTFIINNLYNMKNRHIYCVCYLRERGI
jgi:hypothetical protein